MSVFYALFAAAAFGAVGIAVARGFRHNNLVTALLVSLPVGAVVNSAFMLMNIPPSVTLRAIVLFVVAGIVGEGLGRTSFIFAVSRLGPSTATPIQTATYPVLALLGAWFIFAEAVTVWRVLGAASIVGGIWALVGGEQQPIGAARAAKKSRWAYLLPVAGGISFASSDLLRKLGVTETPYPAFGAAVGTLTILALWALMAASIPRIRSQIKLAPGWQWFLLAGLMAGFGVLSVFAALDTGEVSVVGPIIMAQPLIVVTLSAVFLKDLEKLTWKLVTGAVLTVLGVVVLTLSA